MKQLISITLLFTVLLSFDCVGNKSKKNHSTEMVLIGSDISKRDQNSGVTQVSPGANNTPASSAGTGSGSNNIWSGPTQFIAAATGSQESAVQINQDMTLLRLKVFDEPVLDSAKKSYLNFIVGYNFIESLFYTPNFTGLEIPPANQIFLEIEKIEVINQAIESKFIIPTRKESRVVIYRDKFFFPVLSGVVLPVGSYNSIHVHMKPNGKVRILDKEYSLILDTPKISFDGSFTIELGKVTTLESKALKDFEDEQRNIQREFVRSKFEKNYKSDFVYAFNPNAVQLMNLNIVNRAASIHDSISKLHVNFVSLSISDNGNTSFVLNGVPTRFEMLSLRNGFVGLAGANQVRSGQYEYLELALARTHFIDIGNDQMQIYMDERTQNIFRYYGPYLMNQAEVFESYFHLDPNRSVYFTKDKGFVFDPTIELLSTVTMEPNLEETKIIASAGKFMNTIAAESELVLRGTVSTIAPLLIPNSAGRNIIYSDITLNVTKSLKGKIDPSPFTFRVPGGTLNGITLEVSPMPKFKVGEEVLVYLVKQGNTWKVTRGSLGKVKL